MFGRTPKTTPLDDALLEAVTDAVPQGGATISRRYEPKPGGWFVTVQPVNPDASPFTVGAFGRDGVRFSVGQNTLFDVYGVRKPRHLGLVKQLLSGIVTGRVTEYGGARKGYVEIGLTRGTFKGGHRGFTRVLPFRLRGRRYAPYTPHTAPVENQPS